MSDNGLTPKFTTESPEGKYAMIEAPPQKDNITFYGPQFGTNIAKLEANIEFLAEQVHNAWWEEKKRQAFHSPMECPARFDAKYYTKFVRICDRCHPDMYPYAEIPEHVKEYDRAIVRTVLDAIKKMENPETYECKDCKNRDTEACNCCITENKAGSRPSHFEKMED